MTIKLPDHIVKVIKEAVFKAADEAGYPLSRPNSGVFIDKLVENPDIGGKLSAFMDKSRVRTYIKDGILNRYTKDKKSEKKPVGFEDIIEKCLNVKCAFAEADGDQQIKLYKGLGINVVVADGTFLKWETALRKALIYVAKNSLSKNGNDTKVLLSLFANNKKISTPDKLLLQEALLLCNGCCHIYGER